MKNSNIKAVDELEGICIDDGAQASMIWKSGKILWEGAVADQPHYTWSVTKSFMSVCCGLMVDEGKIEIDEPAGKWLPELKTVYPNVTLRNLLTFTSGLNVSHENPFQLGAPNYSPGSHFHYSLESEWIALAITRIAGESMESLFCRRVAEPIGLTDWSWGKHSESEDISLNGGSGAFNKGITITPRSLLRFGQWAMQKGDWNGQQLLSRHWLEDAHTAQPLGNAPAWDSTGWYRMELPGTYGLHWWTNGIMRNGERLWPSLPGSAFAAQGNFNQICLIIPDWETILVRMGRGSIASVRMYDRVLACLR